MSSMLGIAMFLTSVYRSFFRNFNIFNFNSFIVLSCENEILYVVSEKSLFDASLKSDCYAAIKILDSSDDFFQPSVAEA